MKKIFTILCILFCISSFAQEYFQFKGIPIHGKLQDFGKKLEAQGFTKTGKKATDYMYKGIFANENCEILLSPIHDSDEIKSVYVVITRDNWNSLENVYYKFKEQLSKKYGEPEKTLERFDYPYDESDNSTYKWNATMKDKAHLSSLFTLENGSIFIYIMKDSLIIDYTDKVAKKVSKEKEQETIMDDL